ncbi:tail protein X [Eisenbergiella tayi]|uniref:tail protein X n=1 Tax=Eisenbergiella tayi TaxID=1432052 RepID=UPI00084959C6|nr:tail protein X [Eisenbergiella tayi]ODR35502.1 hypothetical protein BEI60_16370 [Eisenbergiella tayi]
MYITKQGQCWDEIAKEVYGSEKYADYLMEANQHYLTIFVFPFGVQLNTPELPARQTAQPPWRNV